MSYRQFSLSFTPATGWTVTLGTYLVAHHCSLLQALRLCGYKVL